MAPASTSLMHPDGPPEPIAFRRPNLPGVAKLTAKERVAIGRDAEARWAKVMGSPMASVYVTELYGLAVEVIDEIDGAYELVAQIGQPEPGVGTLTVNHEINRHLTHALGAAARMRALCLDRQQPGRDQSPTDLAVQKRGAGWLRSLLREIDLGPILDADVRHSLEHFDEFVDRTSLEMIDGTIALPALVPVDLVLSERHLLQQFVPDGPGTVHFLRVFVSSEERFINCDRETDIAALRLASVEIRDRLEPSMGERPSEEVSAMVVLSKQSFG